MNFGVRSDEKGEYVAAIASLDQAVELKPNDDMAWLTRGVVRVHMKDYGSAVVDFNKAILLNPNRTETYLYRYIAYRETENYQFAFSDINTYVNAMPNDTMARIQRMQLSLLLSEYETMNTDVVWLYERMGDAAKAFAVFCCTWSGIPLIYSGQELPNYKRLRFFEKDEIEWNGNQPGIKVPPKLKGIYQLRTDVGNNNRNIRIVVQ
jgi:hypothetical protein